MHRYKSLLAIAATALLAIATACSDEDTTPSGAPTTQSPTPDESPPQTPSDEMITYEVWFERDDRLFVTTRTEAATQAVGAAAVEALLAGPSTAEADAGVETSIPAGTALNRLTVEGGIAIVDLSEEFASSGTRVRVAQVVYALAQFPTIKGVVIAIDGESAAGEPQFRRDFRDLLPPILVTSPAIGTRLTSPVTVAGTANVFEATVSLRILDANGNEIARDFTTATCGTGCRGDYSTKLKFEVDSQQRGTLEVFEESAEDGSAIHVVPIPVTLVP